MQVINFSGRIDFANVSHLLLDLRKKKDVQQCVLINSRGGFIGFFPCLKSSLEDLSFTAVAEKIYSAAIILFLYGQERLAFPDATFLFHEVRTTLEDGSWVTMSEVGTDLRSHSDALEIYGKTIDEIATIYREMQKGQEWMIDFIVQHSTIMDSELRRLMRDEVTLTAQEAMEYGMVHRIISRETLSG